MIENIQERFKYLWSLVPVFFKNKYGLISFLFLFWMVFLDKNNVSTHYHLLQTEWKLKRDKAEYMKEIEDIKQAQIDLNQNIERFARENYYMQKPGEEVFIISK